MDPKTDIGFTFKEAVDRIDALMVRWRALRPGEIAAGVPPNKTSLAEGVRHLRLRDDSWDILFRAIDGLAQSTTQREAAQESA